MPTGSSTTTRRPSESCASAGGVLVAKLAMSELASFGTGSAYASMHGPGRNPWDPTRWAGGSSTGSAAAVAAGLLPYALASETAGSIGSPSAYCGITGLRPTYGLVSGYGAMPHSWTVDKVGVMAHTAADCGVVLEAIAGGDRRDHGSAFKRFRSRDVSAVRDSGLASVRIGVADYDFEVEATPPVRPALAEGLRAIRDLGVQEREIALPTGVPYLALTSAIVTGEVASALAPLIERDGIDRLTRPEQRTALRAAGSASARDYIDGQRIRLALQRDLALIFAKVDVLVSYTLPWTANSLDADFTAVPMRGGNGALIVAGNLAGLPALFVPVGLATDGLPVGMQLVGRPFSEATLIAIGEALQSATNWHTLRPPIAGRRRDGTLCPRGGHGARMTVEQVRGCGRTLIDSRNASVRVMRCSSCERHVVNRVSRFPWGGIDIGELGRALSRTGSGVPHPASR